MQRLAVFGGSFDPVHYGHIAVADAVQAQVAPDLLIWIPARQAPHKPGQVTAPDEDRLRWLQQVVADRPGEQVSRLELDRPGPSYTVDTLDALREYHPEAEWLLVMGSDSLSHLATWRELERLLRRVEILLVPREGWGPDELQRFREEVAGEAGGLMRARFLQMETVPASSTEVRQRLAAGEPCQDLLPPSVEADILARGSYCSRT